MNRHLPHLNRYLDHSAELALSQHPLVSAESPIAPALVDKSAAPIVLNHLPLARVVESVSNGVVITDPNQLDNPILYVNPAFSRITGYAAEEVLGKNCRLLQGADTDPAIVAEIRTAISEQRPVQATLLNYRKNGDPFWNEISIAPVFSQQNQLLYFVGIQTDITACKRLEETLREQENRLRTIIASEPESVQLISPEGILLEINVAGLTMIEADRPDEVVGHCLYPLITAEYRAAFQQLTQQVCQGGQGNLEFELVGLRGTHRWMETRAVALPQGNQFLQLAITRDITERKQVEAALRESEERWQLALRGNNDGIWDWNIRTNDVFFSARWKSMLGYEDCEISNQLEEWSKRVHPHDLDWVIQVVQDHFAHKTPFYITEHRMLCKDGSYKWILDRGQALWDEAGNPIRMTGSHTDITERKQSEAVLQQTLKELADMKFALDQSSIVSITDLNGKIIYANPKFCEISQYPREELIGKTHKIVNSGYHPPEFFRDLWKTITSGRVWRGEIKNRTKQGSFYWVSSTIVPILNQAGLPKQYISIHFEITERKRAEEQIQAQATLLDKSQDAIMVLDQNDRVQFWNKSAERLLGWTANEVIGQPISDFLKERSAQIHEAYNCVAEQGEWHGELYQITKEGREIIVESRWTRIPSETADSILIVNTDITQKKQLERQFLRTQRMESIGTLSSGIAHDLNNILAPILMSVQLLQMKITDPQSRQWLDILESSTRRGADLVKQVLSFARGIDGERAILQIRHLILEIQQIVIETFPKSIEIYTEVPHDLWAVCGDPTQLHQVLMNLCVNARDAMSEGGTLQITAANIVIDEQYLKTCLDAKLGPHIKITVSDTGCGIPPKLLDRIFEPFFTTKEMGQGTGLGLSTALGILRSHGGFITVNSQVNQGTQFEIYLPATLSLETSSLSETGLPLGRGELILVVDDEAAIREMTSSALESHCYRTLTAMNGIEAIALYTQYSEEISLVLLDMMMPTMDGLTAIRALRRINPEVKIIAASGLLVGDKLIEVSNCGCQKILPKPFTSRDLLLALYEVLSA